MEFLINIKANQIVMDSCALQVSSHLKICVICKPLAILIEFASKCLRLHAILFYLAMLLAE